MKSLGKAISVLLCLLLLSSCGGGSKVRADTELEGHYIAVVGEALGMTLTGDDIDGFDITLQSGGKAQVMIDGETHSASWKNDDTTVTLTIDKEDIVGTRKQDAFTFEDMLGMGVDVTFAKEGTDAADPSHYLSENEKYMLGDWHSVSVADVLGDPVDDMADDALALNFAGDHTMTVRIGGKSLGTFPWSNLGTYGSSDSEDIDLSWDHEEGEDVLEVNYVLDGDYYVFTCERGAASGGSASGSSSGSSSAAAPSAGPLGQIAGTINVPSGGGDHTEAAESAYTDYWDCDWYGWWIIDSAYGDWEELDGSYYDCCASIFVDGDTGEFYLFDETNDEDNLLAFAEVSFGAGLTDAGCMKSESGGFMESGNLGHADWLVDPGASAVSDYEHMIEIDGSYEGDEGGFDYAIYLRPWGMDWEDVRADNPGQLPDYYDSWYVNVMNDPMPDKIETGS